MTASTLRGVVFDLDGVIVDSHPIHKQAWRAFLASVGKQVSESDLDFILEGRCRRYVLVPFLGPLSQSAMAAHGRRRDIFFPRACASLEAVSGRFEIIKEFESPRLPIAPAAASTRPRGQSTPQH